MIKAYVFEKGEPTVVNLDNVVLNRNVLWVNVVNPNKEEIKSLEKKFKLTSITINNCLDPQERPRVDNKDKQSVIIFKTPVIKDKHVRSSSIGIIISKHYLITIQSSKVNIFAKLIKSLDHKLIKNQGYNYLLSHLLLSITRDFFTILDDMDEMVDKLENKILLPGITKIPLDKVFIAKKTLLYFKKALLTNRDVLMDLEKGVSPYVSKIAMDGLVRENLQLVDMEELLRGRLSETYNLYLTDISNNLNVNQKYFAVIAALFLLPMLISGAYGMNFKVLPLALHNYGFWIIIGVMLVSMAIMLISFKKKEWI
jgi:magnesium transporter